MPATAIALTIAGSDSSGGAGIQADLKTFSAFGVYGASVLTALTAQNTIGVQGVHAVPPEFVAKQLRSVLDDLHVGAIKTGMLANSAIVREVATAVSGRGASALVVDPVMVATSGDLLLEPDAIEALRRQLLPLADLVTPNLAEAARLSGTKEASSLEEMAAQGAAIRSLGCQAVLVKGGHGTDALAVDVLVGSDGVEMIEGPRLATRNTHGTGCTLSAAIAALLVHGAPLAEAVRRAKRFITQAIAAGQELGVGHGRGPVDHLYAIRRSPPPA